MVSRLGAIMGDFLELGELCYHQSCKAPKRCRRVWAERVSVLAGVAKHPGAISACGHTGQGI
jgi:hypothetical protein